MPPEGAQEFAVVDQQHAVVVLVCWVDVLVGVVRLDCRLAARDLSWEA